MSLIKRLTEEQKAKFPEYVKKWTSIGLCTEPANRKEAEENIIQAYKAAGLKPPKKIVWCGSPFSLALARAIILDKKIINKEIINPTMAAVWASVWHSGYGQHDANWLAFIDFFRSECGLIKETEKLQPLTNLAKHAGWFLPHENICWVSERHCVLNRNENGRLHSLTEPAVMYPDGWAIYAVNGVRVPEYVVKKPHEITVDKIENEFNAEIKRVMIERYGLENYVKNSNAVLISQDKFGKLYRKEIENDEPLVMVSVINSTPEPDGTYKNYWLRVPPDITTACEAVAWTFGFNKEEYNPLIET